MIEGLKVLIEPVVKCVPLIVKFAGDQNLRVADGITGFRRFKVADDGVLRGILPAVNRYTADLTQAILHKRELVVPCRVEEDLLQKLSALTGSLYDTMAAINEAMDKAPDAEGGIDAARYYREEIVRRMEEARQSIDQLESLTAAKYWPYPTYADILFSV